MEEVAVVVVAEATPAINPRQTFGQPDPFGLQPCERFVALFTMTTTTAVLPPLAKKMYKAVKCRTGPDGEKVMYSAHGKDITWRIGETRTLPADQEHPDPVLCVRGFHACEHPAAPFVLNYGYDPCDKLLEVELGGKLVTDGIKTAGETCTPLRIVSPEEVWTLVAGVAVLRTTDGSTVYHLRNGLPHCDDGPAVTISGWQGWFNDGQLQCSK